MEAVVAIDVIDTHLCKFWKDFGAVSCSFKRLRAGLNELV